MVQGLYFNDEVTMKSIFILFALIFLSVSLNAQVVRLAIIKTGESQNSEFLVTQGGQIFKKSISYHSAFLIQHDNEYILFDTGLGSEIDQQFKISMPWWGQALFKYEKHRSAAEQLIEHNVSVKKFYLSHGHWDHASGLADFKGATAYLNEDELLELNFPKSCPDNAAFLKSQFEYSHKNIIGLKFTESEYYGFKKSYDIFNDQTVVLVSLPGHTKGSVGMFVKTQSKTYFLIGDLVWRNSSLINMAHKFYVASKIVDGNRDQTYSTMKAVHDFMQKHPDVIILPTHDEEVQKPLGYFPSWVM